MALAVENWDQETALALGAELATVVESPAEKYTLQILLARTSRWWRFNERFLVPQYYWRACKFLERDSSYPAAAIWTECAQVLRANGDPIGATKAYEEAIRGTTDLGEALILRSDVAELMMDSGEYDAAQKSIRAGDLEELRDPAVRARERFRRSRIMARCEIAHGRPDRAAPIVGSATPAPDSPLQEAQLLELQGDLAAAQYNPRSASLLLELAWQRYSDASQEDEANIAQLKRLRVVKDQIGDWRWARDLLARFNTQAQSFFTLAPLVAIEATQLASLTGNQELPFLDNPFAEIARQKNPEEHIRLFLTLLEGIKPPAARYQFLKIFAEMETPRRPPMLTSEVMTVVPPPEAGDADFFPRVIGSIELLRFLGWKEGNERLQAALKLDKPSVLPQLLDAAERLQADVPPVETLAQCLTWSGANGFGFTAAVKYTRLALERGKTTSAIQARLRSQVPIPEELRGTQIEAVHNLNSALLPDQTDQGKRLARHRAAEILRQLGQDRNVARIVGPLHGQEAQAEGSWNKKPRATIALQEVSLPWPLVTNRELAPYELAKRLAAPPGESIPELKRALAEWELTAKVGVKLSIDDAAAAMLPWEWALADHDICFRSSSRFPKSPGGFYRTIGAKLPPRVRQFFTFFRPLRVIILRPPTSSQESIGRGFELQSRRRLTDIYATHGVRAIEPAGLEPEHIKLAMTEHDPDVVHIQAAVLERRRNLQLDLPLRYAVPSPEYLVEQFNGDSKPIIILDPPRPLEDVETARQLLLRNRFAPDLIATGRVRAVLAAGLLLPQDLQHATELLAYRLGGLPLFRELLDLFRRDLNPDRFSSDGAALFAPNPDEIIA
ncbi:tetratricopeptide repeat protein [Bradyrhizobium japonicum]|uniref:tetratricopeptide repeat protein n=1 Tax=Bradyrhizobium japonicum TaxID=375 RepID=UPI00209EC5E5|nr:hypothetical protein [Bradyrhizobium japonicum]MCP1783885.1 hypothetical protein [Bradyrhizobium japonicum]MCP1963827.1 hypothetical protein [Bradyrhizobium japonicum]